MIIGSLLVSHCEQKIQHQKCKQNTNKTKLQITQKCKTWENVNVTKCKIWKNVNVIKYKTDKMQMWQNAKFQNVNVTKYKCDKM